MSVIFLQLPDFAEGAIMFDFPSFVPTAGNHHRYNEQWYVSFLSLSLSRYMNAHFLDLFILGMIAWLRHS